MRRCKKLPSPPMVIACPALPLSLSGTGYAALSSRGTASPPCRSKHGMRLAREIQGRPAPVGRRGDGGPDRPRSAEDRSGRGVVAAGPCTTSSHAGDSCVTRNDPRFVAVFTYDGPGSEPKNHTFYVAVIGWIAAGAGGSRRSDESDWSAVDFPAWKV